MWRRKPAGLGNAYAYSPVNCCTRAAVLLVAHGDAQTRICSSRRFAYGTAFQIVLPYTAEGAGIVREHIDIVQEKEKVRGSAWASPRAPAGCARWANPLPPVDRVEGMTGRCNKDA